MNYDLIDSIPVLLFSTLIAATIIGNLKSKLGEFRAELKYIRARAAYYEAAWEAFKSRHDWRSDNPPNHKWYHDHFCDRCYQERGDEYWIKKYTPEDYAAWRALNPPESETKQAT